MFARGTFVAHRVVAALAEARHFANVRAAFRALEHRGFWEVGRDRIGGMRRDDARFCGGFWLWCAGWGCAGFGRRRNVHGLILRRCGGWRGLRARRRIDNTGRKDSGRDLLRTNDVTKLPLNCQARWGLVAQAQPVRHCASARTIRFAQLNIVNASRWACGRRLRLRRKTKRIMLRAALASHRLKPVLLSGLLRATHPRRYLNDGKRNRRAPLDADFCWAPLP